MYDGPMVHRHVTLAAVMLVVACGKAPAEAAPDAPSVAVSAIAPPPPSAAPSTPAPAPATATVIPDGEPLKAGLVDFQGVVRPTKGGYEVRGVVLAAERMARARQAGAVPTADEELLGARLRVVARLQTRPEPPATDGEAMVQTRGGGWMATELVELKLVAAPVMLEGTVSRSKGLFQVGDRMVSREDLAWSLRGVEPVGKRVRLWGQPRDYRCPPMAQCLLGGEIPMFDIGRAELP